MISTRPERHPWMKTFTVMSIIYMVGQGLFGISSSTSGWEVVLSIVFAAVWIYAGIYLIRETSWYNNWTIWLQRHRIIGNMAYYYMVPGAILTFFLLAIPFVIIRGITQGFSDIS